MLEVLERCFPEQLASTEWQERLRTLLPSHGTDAVDDPVALSTMRERSNALLGLSA